MLFYLIIGAALVGIAWVIWYFWELRPTAPYDGPTLFPTINGR